MEKLKTKIEQPKITKHFVGIVLIAHSALFIFRFHELALPDYSMPLSGV